MSSASLKGVQVGGRDIDHRLPFDAQFDLGAAAHVTLPAMGVNRRTENLLKRWGVVRVLDLAGRTPDGFLGLRGAGALTLQDLTAALHRLERAPRPPRDPADIQARNPSVTGPPTAADGYAPPPWESWGGWDDAVAGITENPGNAPVDEVARHLPLVAAWFTGRTAATSFRDLLAVPTDVHLDPQVMDALEALAQVRLYDLAGDALGTFDPVERIARHLRTINERDRVAFTRRSQPGPPSLETVGIEFGLTRERIRQIERRVLNELLRHLRSDEVVGEVIAALRRRIGPVTAEIHLRDAVNDLMPRLGELGEGDQHVVVRLVKELLGPYTARNELLVSTEGAELLDDLAAWIGSSPDLSADGVLQWVADQLPSSPHADALIEELGFEIFHGQLLQRGSGMQDRAHLVLVSAGSPLPFRELVSAMPDGTNERSFRNALFADPRIVRVDRDEFGLASWGLEEYTGVADAIERELARRGGQARITDLADELAERFDVSPSSVAAYARSARFVQIDRGSVRLRAADEDIEEGHLTPLGLQHGCVRVDGRWAIRITVDEKLLDGYSALTPPAFAAHVGAGPLESILLDTELDLPISMIRAALQPSLGRLRPVAQQLGLGPGSLLFVIAPAEPGGVVTFHAVPVEQVEDADARTEALLHLGLSPDATLSEIACALDLQASATDDEIHARLRARREEDLSEALATESASDDDVTGRDVADILGL